MSSSHHVPVFDTSAMTAALANPYAQTYGMSPHYYQAYIQALYNRPHPASTAEGYTLSSTYVPRQGSFRIPSNQLLPSPSEDRVLPPPVSEKRVITNPLTHGSWYQPGNFRCQRQGCPFLGSRKSVEIHMMDRHFIFPPGWEKSKDEWDADPSLKGKAIPIQGTSVLLDTPEALDSWIAERRKRFPTAERVQEKKRKMEEAVARGQLAPEDMGLAGRKKRRHDHTTDGPIVRPDDRGKRGRGRGRDRDRDRGMGPGREAHVRRGEIGSVVNDQKPTAIGSVSLERLAQENHPGTSFESEEEGPPEEISSKTPLSSKDPSSPTVAEGPVLRIKAPSKPPPLQPRRPQRSSFLSKPALLRNLLLPEIRITVSNLSQAIRFLVANNFLEDVELRPGDAHQKMIEVVGSSDKAHSSSATQRNQKEKLIDAEDEYR